MTDKQRVESLLRELGVGFCEEDGITPPFGREADKGTSLVCKEGMDKVGGYNMFFVTFEFNEDGKFLQMGAWE